MALRVLFLIPSLRGGGAERVLATLLQHIDRTRFRVSLAVVDARDAVYRQEIPEDIDVIDLRCRRVLHALPRIVALIWRERPDVVFSTLGHLNLALALIRPLLPRGIRVVARETSIVSETIGSERYPRLWAFLYRRFYRRLDLVVCQSRYMEADLISRFLVPPSRTLVIHNPVDIDRIRLLARESIPWPVNAGETITLVAAGRLTSVKGFDTAIRALSSLDRSDVRLVILGDGPMRAQLEALACTERVADRVCFVGFQRNPHPWFRRADGFVLSSRHEGFPNVVLEAMTCGTPVVATAAPGGTREILEPVPSCVIADGINVHALRTALQRWLESGRSRVCEDAVEPYRVEPIVRRYEDALDAAGLPSR